MKLTRLILGALPGIAAIGGGFAVAFAASTVVVFLIGGTVAAVEVEQPLAFNHRVHVEGEGLECAACHQHFATETYSGLPPAAMCSLCHSEAQGESAAEAELVRMLEAGEPLEWAPLFRQPPHVFFSHRRHVSVAGLECTECHGDIGQSEAPPAFANPLKMDQCLACHAERGVTEDCSECHR